MSFRPGDLVWVLTTGRAEVAAGKLLAGQILRACVRGAPEEGYHDYVVDVPDAPYSPVFDYMRWCFKWQLFPRFDGQQELTDEECLEHETEGEVNRG